MNDNDSSNTHPVQTDGAAKPIFAQNKTVNSSNAGTLRQWGLRRWNEMCLAISFLFRILIGIAAFSLISLSGAMLLQRIDDMDIASRASNDLSPFATTMPWLTVGVLVLVVLCIPGVISEFTNLLRRLKKVGNCEFSQDPFDNQKNRDRFVELIKAVFKEEVERSKHNREDSENPADKQTLSAVNQVFRSWDEIDATEQGLLLLHARNIGAELVSRNIHFTGRREVFDGLLRRGSEQIFVECKTFTRRISITNNILRAAATFRNVLASLSESVTKNTYFHLVISLPEHLEDSKRIEIRRLIDEIPRCAVFFYPD